MSILPEQEIPTKARYVPGASLRGETLPSSLPGGLPSLPPPAPGIQVAAGKIGGPAYRRSDAPAVSAPPAEAQAAPVTTRQGADVPAFVDVVKSLAGPSPLWGENATWSGRYPKTGQPAPAVASPPQGIATPSAATALGEDPETRMFGKTQQGPAGIGVNDKPPRSADSAAVPAAPPAGEPGDLLRGRDSYGNLTWPTELLKAQLRTVREDNAAEQKDREAYQNRVSRQNMESDLKKLTDLAAGGAPLSYGQLAAMKALMTQVNAGRTAEGATAQQEGMSLDSKRKHDAEMARILGTPLDQRNKELDAAIKSGTLKQAQALQTLQEKLLAAGQAGNVEEQAQLALLMRQLAGKDAERGQLIPIGGGQTVDPDTGMLRTLPAGAAYLAPGASAPTILRDQKPAGATPTLEQFTAHVLGKNKGEKIPQADIVAAYKKQFGG